MRINEQCVIVSFMRRASISDADSVILILQDEIRRSYEARYDHRLHAILLVAQGMSCRQVSNLLGDSPRAIAYWVQRTIIILALK